MVEGNIAYNTFSSFSIPVILCGHKTHMLVFHGSFSVNRECQFQMLRIFNLLWYYNILGIIDKIQ